MAIRKKLNEMVEKIPYIGDILTTEVSATGLVAAVMAGYLALVPAKAEAVGGTAEVTVGHEYASLDTRLSGSLGEKVGLFVWNIAGVDYNGNGSNFTLTDLTYQLVDGLSLVFLETQFIDDYGSVRAGLQYYGEDGDFNIFILATGGVPFGVLDDPTGELTVMVGYDPMFSDDIGLYLRGESIINVGGEGHNSSSQKFRAGVYVDGKRVGVSVDLAELGNGGDLSCNVGVSVRVDL